MIAAEGRRRIGAVRALDRPVTGVAAVAMPHGLACLTMTQAGAPNALTAFQRGVGVDDVVERQLLACEHLRAVATMPVDVLGRST